MLTFLITAATVVGVVAAGAAGRGRRRKGADGVFLLAFALILAGGIAYLIGILLSKVFGMASSRLSEFAADERGAMLSTDGFALASALEKMASQTGAVSEHNTPATSLFIVDLNTRSGAAPDVFATHPDTAERVARLRSLASELHHPDFRPAVLETVVAPFLKKGDTFMPEGDTFRSRRSTRSVCPVSPPSLHSPKEPAFTTVYLELWQSIGFVDVDDLYRRVLQIRPMGKSPAEARRRYDKILSDLRLAGALETRGQLIKLRPLGGIGVAPLGFEFDASFPRPRRVGANTMRLGHHRQRPVARASALQRSDATHVENGRPLPVLPESHPPAVLTASILPSEVGASEVSVVVVGVSFEVAARSAHAFLSQQGYRFGTSVTDVALAHSLQTPDGGWRLVYAYGAGWGEKTFAVDVSASGQVRGIVQLSDKRWV